MAKPTPPTPTIPPAYLPPKWEIADVAAIQACCDGKATPEQQKRAIDWVVLYACCTDDVEYRPSEREHVLASGRRFVGLQIRKLMSLNLSVLRDNQAQAIPFRRKDRSQ